MFEILSAPWLHHAIQAYGLWALFVVVALESMGLPLPGETALISAAVYAGTTHGLPIAAVIGIAAAGAIAGDNLGFLIGRRIGLPMLERYGRHVGFDKGRLKLGQYLFLRHGGKIVFLGRFVAFLRAFAAVLAGTNRMPWPHFLVANGLGGLCWSTLFGVGAYLFGQEIHRVAGPVGLVVLASALLLVVLATHLLRRHEAEWTARAMAALPDDAR
ncbi:MAG TPA: DedA family protein [Geminicoccus sp.]|jgi:membrane protein DedA with SNARE-associated domain|uniref:DedA family protein n=1 Tax=Geminicoccus sp. TaxID=2024832 RepID=UPI002E334201|nr:DedA family protein [Geminicoccus sp.]HEX2527126.1 DedA family protein [Geminicoccus sp.]